MLLGRSLRYASCTQAMSRPDGQRSDCALPYYGLTFFQDDCVAALRIRLSLESCA